MSAQAGRARALQQSQDVLNLPEEPVTEETVEAYHEAGGAQWAAEPETDEDVDGRTWYRKPSPWWMLILMPITAMTLAGVTPSLLQVYTDLACKAINKPATATLHETQFAPFNNNINLSRNLYFVGIESDPFLLHSVSIADVSGILQISEDVAEERNCASDPNVQAAVSKLMTALTSTLGILSCLTAASWGSLSDRLGRRPVLAIASSAVVINYSVLIFVSYYADHLPGGYWFLLVGTVIFGILGGTAATTAATYAYITDCTPAPARAHILSLTLGLRFTGMAAGPTLCALLVQLTGTPVAALAFVVVVHVAHIAVVLFVLPESLSSEKREENKRTWHESLERVETTRVDNRAGSLPATARQSMKSLMKSLFAVLRPLSVVAPIAVSTGASGNVHKDWSLTVIATSAGLASLILASYSTMFQFGAATFGWSPVELGYWFSGIVAARALTLTLILPIIIKFYHHFTSSKNTVSYVMAAESSETTPLISSQADGHETSDTQSQSKHLPPRHSPAFDLRIAQASLALEVTCYALVPLLISHWGKHVMSAYIALTVLASCGSGFGPAIQALAVELYSARGGTETGRLFGVLGVVQATSSQIIGPAIYGLTYVKIVAVYPQGIFFVSVGATASALLALLLVELPGSRKTVLTRADGAA